MDVETRVREMIVSVVGDTEAVDIDLNHVAVVDRNTRSVGDPDRDGSVTIDDNDVVTVWAQGSEADSDLVPGSFEHFTEALSAS